MHNPMYLGNGMIQHSKFELAAVMSMLVIFLAQVLSNSLSADYRKGTEGDWSDKNRHFNSFYLFVYQECRRRSTATVEANE